MRGLGAFFGTTTLLVGLASAPAVKAQVVVDIGVQPVCSYGYYGYAPYACAPMGYYGPGYFYNGIFLGMGPWGGWGYSHGWGGHRFVSEGGGNYHGGPGRIAYNGNADGAVRGGGAGYHSGATGVHPAERGGAAHATSARPTASRAGGARPSASHSAAPHSNGTAAHGGGSGGHEGGGEHR
ncbi:MAG: hypothetical protein ABSB60_14800 [Terracidiphilus sp.]